MISRATFFIAIALNESLRHPQALVVCIFLGVGMSILSASFSSFLVAERMNNAKHLQMVSGVDKVLFWVTSYLSDLINYLMPFTLIFVCFAAFNQDVFTANNGLAGIAMLLLFFGVSAIPLSYLCHFPFKTPMNSLVAQVTTFTCYRRPHIVPHMCAGVRATYLPTDLPIALTLTLT